MMTFIQNDGGRAAAGYSGKAGDCVCRAIAIAARLPYEQVYDVLAKGNAEQKQTKRTIRSSRGVRTAARGIYTERKWFKDYMVSLGFTWVPTMGIGTGCKVHLHDGELPAVGRLVVAVSKHYTAVIDSQINDTHDPRRNAHCFRRFQGWQTAALKPGEQRNENGIWSVQRRCVYGFWILRTTE